MQWPWSSAYRLEPAVATTLIGISAWWANGSVKQYAGDLTAESRGVVGFDVEFVGAYWDAGWDGPLRSRAVEL